MSRPDDDAEPPTISRWAFIPDWFRNLSWFAIALGILMMGNAEFGFPPDKFHWRPKTPIATLRLQYASAFAIGLPGAIWSIVRAAKRQQRSPWG